MLVLYVDHIGRSLRVSSLIELVGDDTRRLVDEQYPDELTGIGAGSAPHGIVAGRSGVVTSIDREGLVELAASAGCILHVVPALGSFIPAGSTLIDIEGTPDRIDRGAATDCVEFGLERTLDEDAAYGFRMLVDVAERALSESPFLDPTTAVQAIDRLHDALRQLSGRVIPDGRHHDDAGTLRLTVPAMEWDAYVHLAFDEIRLVGSESPQVSRRLIAALTDLIAVAPRDRQPVLVEQLELLRAAICELPRDRRDIDRSLTADGQGLGVVV